MRGQESARRPLTPRKLTSSLGRVFGESLQGELTSEWHDVGAGRVVPLVRGSVQDDTTLGAASDVSQRGLSMAEGEVVCWAGVGPMEAGHTFEGF